MLIVKPKYLSLFIGAALSSNVFADARSTLTFENNCAASVQFSIDGDGAGQSFAISLAPNQYYHAGRYTNANTLSHTTSKIKVAFAGGNQSGSLIYLLNNGTTSNTATFKRQNGNITVEHLALNKDYKTSWHSYTLSGKLQIPSFTVSACAQNISPAGSELDGINRVIIFGDSLSDQGSLYDFSGGLIPKSTPYYSGMFSNGNVWSVLLKNSLKTTSNIEVSNYAVGGATAVFNPSWASLGLPYNLDAEIKLYQLDKKAWSGEKRLAIFFIGANDYLTANKSMSEVEINHAVDQVVAKITAGVTEVGADKTIIIGLPDLSLTPEAHELGNEAVLAALSQRHNALLASYAADKNTVTFIDLNSMFNLLLKDTERFNKEYNTQISTDNLKRSCWQGGYFARATSTDNQLDHALLERDSIEGNSSRNFVEQIALSPAVAAAIRAAETGYMCNDPEHYIFWDHVHPTYQIQKALYQYILGELGLKN